MPGRSASTRAMSLRYGSGGRTARRCRAPPAPRSPCRCSSRVFDLLPKAPRSVDAGPGAAQPRQATMAGDALHLLFPPPGAVLSADGPVTIRVMGGRRPLTFLVDGAPLPADRIRREAAWLPLGPRLLPADRAGRRWRRGARRGTGRAPRHDARDAGCCWHCSAWPPAPPTTERTAGRRNLPADPRSPRCRWKCAATCCSCEAKIDGEPVTLLVDTGAERTLLTEAAVDRLHLPRDLQHATRTFGIGSPTASLGRQAAERVWYSAATHFPVDSVTVGRFGIHEVAGGSADGLLGADILLAFDIDLDLPARRHHVLPRPPRLPRCRAAVERTLRRRRRRQHAARPAAGAVRARRRGRNGRAGYRRAVQFDQPGHGGADRSGGRRDGDRPHSDGAWRGAGSGGRAHPPLPRVPRRARGDARTGAAGGSDGAAAWAMRWWAPTSCRAGAYGCRSRRSGCS